ncbi:MAG TPA: thioredoxin-disulfide reductase [Candidatus Absconditabacterales bacterium]|nr:thioredoxin-disulfide reductase [Candidatus Absconditabacterales bacterium]HOQ78706.1 thioredoxin-disulfide reductase [Candidatus Absconditabacterales bacterium]HPK27724.1 thioredoxin-disulfide reductase [Candidatus Absconditabacterales bacterium]
MENVIIIGSGPAGHTSAIYASKALLNPLMFEGFMAGGIAAGGQLTTTTIVENFPGFPDGIDGSQLMHNMRKQSINSGARIETKTVDKVDLSASPFKIYVGGEMFEAKTVIIATGATAKRMGLLGEARYRGRGVSACAICDGGLPIFRDQHIIVIGGGDTAMEEAIHLTHFASKVTVLVRRDELRASKIMQERAKSNPKIEFLWNTEAKEILGVEGGNMTGLRIVNNKTNEESVLEAKGLFYAIGHTPNTSFLDGQLELDEAGYIITKPGSTQTSVPGVFAAGDVQDKKFRQAVTSAGTGCMAAIEAEKYLNTL